MARQTMGLKRTQTIKTQIAKKLVTFLNMAHGYHPMKSVKRLTSLKLEVNSRLPLKSNLQECFYAQCAYPPPWA